ncbi:MAG: class I SAM-dependent methyltransferase [Nanoarchaeota archaeon]
MNRKFFYEQYNKINWTNQEKNKINFDISEFIIQKIIAKKKGKALKVFDMGFGIGSFIKMLSKALGPKYEEIIIEGCEPSTKNYNFFINKQAKRKQKAKVKVYNTTFLGAKTDKRFDFITAIYVFPHFLPDELKKTAEKISSMLEPEGRFIMAVASETRVKEKLKEREDLLIKRNTLNLFGKKYKQVLHYSEIKGIGTVVDHNRENRLYIDLFKKQGLKLVMNKNIDKNGTTIFVFKNMEKENMAAKKLKEDLIFAKRTEEAMKRYEKGEFIELSGKDFLKKLVKN